MRRIRLIGLGVALASVVGFGPTAKADPITEPILYTTSGSIGAAGDPNGPVVFHGILTPQPSEFMFPGTIDLGRFSVPSLPATASLTYHDTPFTIDAWISDTPGGPASPATEVRFTGILDGTVTGNSQSTLLATVTSIEPLGPGSLPFPAQALTVDPQLLTPGGNSTNLVAKGIDGGAPHVPEPATLLLFGTAFAGLGLRRRLLAGR